MTEHGPRPAMLDDERLAPSVTQPSEVLELLFRRQAVGIGDVDLRWSLQCCHNFGKGSQGDC